MRADVKKKMRAETKEFNRFDNLLRKVISVPKEEINRREKEEKQKKVAKKKG